MMSVATGHDAGYLTGCVAQGGESYYLDAATSGEPAGVWDGAGAEALGLVGEVDPEIMTAVYGEFLDPRDPLFADPETRSESARLGRAPQRPRDVESALADRLKLLPGTPLPEEEHRIRADLERSASGGGVPYLDLTFSPSKSVTVLHTAFHRAELDALKAGDEGEAAEWAGRRLAVEAAVWEGSRAMLEHAHGQAGYSRAGSTAETRWIPDEGWTVASFFQHTSRALDPQLHIHNAVLNRVIGEDGKVRTLDSKAIHSVKQGAGTIGDRTMEESLARSLGVQWRMRADGVGREIVGVDEDVMDLFSSRSRTLSGRAAELVKQAEEQRGRPLVAYEVDRIRRAASMATRQAKTHDGETTEQMLDRWDAESRSVLAGGLSRIANQFRTNGEAVGAQQWSPEAVTTQAVAACQKTQTTWGRSELTRNLLLALPDHLGGLDAPQIAALANRLADQALESTQVVQVTGADLDVPVPEMLQRPDGTSVYAAPTGARYAEAGHLVAEEALRRAAVVRGREAAPKEAVEAWLAEHGSDLLPDQVEAVRGITTSTAALTVLVGPAGTGKSYTAGAISAAWSATTGGRVLGLATSENATQVLRDDGLSAVNISQFLDAQDSFEAGGDINRLNPLRLSPLDVLLVDEASMVATPELNRLRAITDAAGTRIVWTGDPAQLGAVGAGGMMAAMAGGEAETYSLSEVRRFAEGWERTASLQLRDGDVDVLTEYDRRGRLIDAGTLEEAAEAAGRAYVADRLQGLSSLVVVGSNDAAAALSASIRQRLVDLGKVEADGLILGRDGCTAGVGDVVAARRNDYDLQVTNRQQYEVRAVNEEGGLVVRPVGGGPERTLPAAYVDEHVSLGYASTVHGAQGVTVDRGHLVADETLSREAGYVGLSRGRLSSTAYVATVAVDGDGRRADARSASAVMSDVLDRHDVEGRAAIVQAAEDDANLRSEAFTFARIEDAVRVATRARTDRMLDDLTAEGVLLQSDRARLGADQGTEYLSRVLRRAEQAGHDPAEVLREAVADPRGLARTKTGDVQSVGQLLSARITSGTDLTPELEVAAAAPANVPADMGEYLGQLRDRADERRRELGSQVAAEVPTWAAEAFGPVPEDVIDRADWEHKAGVVAAHREVTGWTDETQPIGSAPSLAFTERQVSHHQAWLALGRPEAHLAEAALSDGALRVRVAAWEREQANAPEFVDPQLRASSLAAARAEQDATLAAAAEDQQEADDAAADAELAQVVAVGLTEAAEVRDAWLAATAVTRDTHDRAAEEMARRGLPPLGQEEDRTTADDWLQAEARSRVEDDVHREVTESDVLDPDAEEHRAHEQSEPHEDHAAADVVESPAVIPVTREVPDHRAVPITEIELEATVARARVAADQLADRASQEAALRTSEATEAAEEGYHRQETVAPAVVDEFEPA